MTELGGILPPAPSEVSSLFAGGLGAVASLLWAAHRRRNSLDVLRAMAKKAQPMMQCKKRPQPRTTPAASFGVVKRPRLQTAAFKRSSWSPW